MSSVGPGVAPVWIADLLGDSSSSSTGSIQLRSQSCQIVDYVMATNTCRKCLTAWLQLHGIGPPDILTGG